MKYERLTAKKLRDTDIFRVLDENGNVVVDKRLFERFIEQHNRLAELEDKIEQGTLIDLPCKVGDTVYVPWIWDGVYGVATVKIEEIKFYDTQMHYMFFIDMDSDDESYNQEFGGWKIDQSIGETVFLTREEAEKRLLELQGDK